jgi:hypothetical protein
VNAQEIVQRLQNRNAPIDPTETRGILNAIRSEAEAQLNAVLVGVLMHHKAQALAAELEVIIGDAQATAETATARVDRLQQAVEGADLAVRRAKADRIMLPGTASQSELAQADQAIQRANHSLQTAQGNLQKAKTVAEQQQRELENLRAVHRALTSVGMPDPTPIRALMDAAGG